GCVERLRGCRYPLEHLIGHQDRGSLLARIASPGFGGFRLILPRLELPDALLPFNGVGYAPPVGDRVVRGGHCSFGVALAVAQFPEARSRLRLLLQGLRQLFARQARLLVRFLGLLEQAGAFVPHLYELIEITGSKLEFAPRTLDAGLERRKLPMPLARLLDFLPIGCVTLSRFESAEPLLSRIQVVQGFRELSTTDPQVFKRILE